MESHRLRQVVANFSYLWFGANFSIQSYIALCLPSSNLFSAFGHVYVSP